MSETDVKPRRDGETAPRPRFGGGTTLKFRGGFGTGTKFKGPTAKIEDVVLQGNLSAAKMLTRWRTNMDKLAQYVGKEFGGTGSRWPLKPYAAVRNRLARSP